jgi:cell wall-associated NlpC family hydrolase
MWFGIHYFGSDTKWPTDPIKAVLRGEDIPKVDTTSTDAAVGTFTTVFAAGATSGGGSTTVPTAGGGSGAAPSGGQAAIAAKALTYVGQGYVFGGHADRPGDWDCSSFVSYVLGHDFGLPLPGGGRYGAGGYPPNAHGPVAAQYKLYGVGINASQVQAGDIVAWNTHVGIAVDNSRTVAARTVATGTGVSTISGTSASIGETPVYRRISLSSSGSSSGGGGTVNV